MIRFIAGFLIVMGAVGTLDIDPTASVLVQSGIGTIGLALMYLGAKKIARNKNF